MSEQDSARPAVLLNPWEGEPTEADSRIGGSMLWLDRRAVAVLRRFHANEEEPQPSVQEPFSANGQRLQTDVAGGWPGTQCARPPENRTRQPFFTMPGIAFSANRMSVNTPGRSPAKPGAAALLHHAAPDYLDLDGGCSDVEE